MKIVLEFPANKTKDLMKILEGISYVKVEQTPNGKTQLMAEIKEVVENLKLARKEKIKAGFGKEYLDGSE